MPRIANMAASRQENCEENCLENCHENCEPSRRRVEKPRIRMPARENRAASRISGGQSVTPILPATKAKLQSRQNTAIANGRLLKRLEKAWAGTVIGDTAEIGADM